MNTGEPMTVAELTRGTAPTETKRYARCIEASKRIRWEIERDVIQGRRFDFSQRFLPEGLARIAGLEFLWPDERRLLSQIQGRTYANMFALVERFIGAKMLEISRAHWFGDQVALEALVRFADEELKHQALFRRVEELAAEGMPDGYHFVPEPNAVAQAVMAASTWAVLALTCHIELFTQVHYRQSLEPDSELSPLYKDVFLFHWLEESQHAIVDELEWARENAQLTPAQRDAAVDDLIGLVGAVDGIVQAQAGADTAYFLQVCGRAPDGPEAERVAQALLAAYRWQYIASGVRHPHFASLLGSMLNDEQAQRVGAALAPLML
jgi:DNA-binding Lrp family transcriptional regulator